MDQSVLSSRAIIGAYFARMEANHGLSWVEDVSDFFLSDQVAEEYRFIGQVPTMREWQGPRLAKGLHNLTPIIIPNQQYEATLEVNVRDLRRDKTDQLVVRIDEFADRSKTHWASLLSHLLSISETAHSYDGVPFFSASHTEGESGAQSNIIAVDISELTASWHGLPAIPSIEEVQQAVGLAVTHIMSFKDDRGELNNESARRFLVMVPVHYAMTFQAAFNPESVKALPGNMNPNSEDQSPFEVRVVANPRLSWTDKFAVFRADGSTKALIRQSETDIRMRAKGEGSEHEFETDTWHFGIDASRGVWFGHWQRACLVQLV